MTNSNDLILFPDIGLMGYTTRCRIIDSRGLTDKIVADYMYAGQKNRKVEANRKRFLDYFFQNHPTVVALVIKKDTDRGHHLADKTLYQSDKFHQTYRLYMKYPYYSGTELFLYVPKDWKGLPDDETTYERFKLAIRENPHVPGFYLTFIRILNLKGKKTMALYYRDVFKSRFPALVGKKVKNR
jgi:hypothetical protein